MENTQKEITKYINKNIDRFVSKKKKVGLDTNKMSAYAQELNVYIDSFDKNINRIIKNNKVTNQNKINELKSFANELNEKRIFEAALGV